MKLYFVFLIAILSCNDNIEYRDIVFKEKNISNDSILVETRENNYCTKYFFFNKKLIAKEEFEKGVIKYKTNYFNNGSFEEYSFVRTNPVADNFFYIKKYDKNKIIDNKTSFYTIISSETDTIQKGSDKKIKIEVIDSSEKQFDSTIKVLVYGGFDNDFNIIKDKEFEYNKIDSKNVIDIKLNTNNIGTNEFNALVYIVYFKNGSLQTSSRLYVTYSYFVKDSLLIKMDEFNEYEYFLMEKISKEYFPSKMHNTLFPSSPK